ncbi:DNA primase [Methanoculleus taiwanensis]|uniref:DNA primase small subunit PriS n=1 Tax=Methanoculleus taiwanensis TaxID=1550565 RepID=A0A498H300_9EURY|nr:DNA primase small subunit PriS [Methanoculleus taiwanensis]RXE57193.1 DNA primase [Methanoculleus taiwanensis]
MKPATLEFLKQRFTEYYRNGHLPAPSSLEQREWGFIFFDTSSDVRMRRHMAFTDQRELADYLRSMIPAHAYYSTAYYGMPGAPTMNDKVWTGADLIFDLDADHIMRGPYAEMLARVKEETEKLIAMLTGELGFSAREISVVFSGGRGYHIHVKDIAIREWGSQERRELIDYVCGTGLDPGVMLAPVRTPPGGWKRRYLDALGEHLLWLKGLPEDEAIGILSDIKGIKQKQAAEFLTEIDDLVGDLRERRTESLLASRTIRALISGEGSAFEQRVRAKGAHADEPVTTDIKRLIRMPGSLHGGSGMRVVPLGANELAGFDPLVDAVVFGERDVKVEMKTAIATSLLGNTYTLQKGITTIPEALAVFVCCRGMAEVAGEGSDGS